MVWGGEWGAEVDYRGVLCVSGKRALPMGCLPRAYVRPTDRPQQESGSKAGGSGIKLAAVDRKMCVEGVRTGFKGGILDQPAVWGDRSQDRGWYS